MEKGDKFAQLDTAHSDTISDLKFNHYGNKLATCGADHMIKVWELTNSQWKQTAEWKAHDALIHKLAWAPPEYGDILASCSYDRTVIIWGKSGTRSGPQHLAKWTNRAKLVDSRQSVNDIAFAPKHMGLMIATCSNDGSVRIYEAIDVMNLMHWPLVDEFEVARDGSGASCIAWCPNQFILPSLVVGGEKKVQVWRQVDGRKWTIAEGLEQLSQEAAVNGVAWCPNLGRSYELIATASQDRTVRIWKMTGDTAEQVACFRDHKAEVWHVEFNVTGTVLASSGDDGVVRLWTRDLSTPNGWMALESVTADD